MYETFDHTADLGLRIRAADCDTLFAEAGRALFSVIVEDLDAVEDNMRVELTIAGNDLAYLFYDSLRELLFRFDVEHLLLSRFDVQVRPEGLVATAWGQPFDPSRHELAHEVKAITYHGLLVAPEPGGWMAEVIVDI